MPLTLVELKEKLKPQLKVLANVEEFRVKFARYNPTENDWDVGIVFVEVREPDQAGRQFRVEKYANLSTTSEGKIMNFSIV